MADIRARIESIDGCMSTMNGSNKMFTPMPGGRTRKSIKTKSFRQSLQVSTNSTIVSIDWVWWINLTSYNRCLFETSWYTIWNHSNEWYDNCTHSWFPKWFWMVVQLVQNPVRIVLSGASRIPLCHDFEWYQAVWGWVIFSGRQPSVGKPKNTGFARKNSFEIPYQLATARPQISSAVK